MKMEKQFNCTIQLTSRAKPPMKILLRISCPSGMADTWGIKVDRIPLISRSLCEVSARKKTIN